MWQSFECSGISRLPTGAARNATCSVNQSQGLMTSWVKPKKIEAAGFTPPPCKCPPQLEPCGTNPLCLVIYLCKCSPGRLQSYVTVKTLRLYSRHNINIDKQLSFCWHMISTFHNHKTKQGPLNVLQSSFFDSPWLYELVDFRSRMRDERQNSPSILHRPFLCRLEF